ncbi:MAG: AAA family ATPase, partial [Prevotellaceae bacterium]|nr:AAA family ATPase [Prevotellaceae bacterium]
MNTARKMPVGMQDFEDLRTEGFLYVDKTEYVYRLATQGKPYFLSRPRRFGKSLFLSTLKAYFEGKRELFEGLKIAEMEKDWIKYPVIYLDFNVGLLTGATNVAKRLSLKIREFELLWGKKADIEDLASRFEAVIESAYEQTGKKVVVLIDEYDKPLINTMEDEASN